MKQVDKTFEILLWKLLNRNVNQEWSDWATEMLIVGYDTEHLIELAGIESPYNQFELCNLTDKVFEELKLDYNDRDKIIRDYISYLSMQIIENKRDLYKTLRDLRDLCIELDYDKLIYNFYSLAFAKEDLEYSEIQCYWEGADRNNIDKICMDYFKKWLIENPIKINE